MLGQFSRDRNAVVVEYIDFVRAGVGLPNFWGKLNSQIYLGGERFVDRMKQSVPPKTSLDEVPRAQHRPIGKPLEDYVTSYVDPKVGMAKAYLSGDYTMKEIAQRFRVHYSTVSRAVRAIEAKNSK